MTTVLQAHGTKPQLAEGQEQTVDTRVQGEVSRCEPTLARSSARGGQPAGVALSQVRDLLGHSSIITTERYDNQAFAALQSAAGKLDRGQSFKIPSRSDTDNPTDESNADANLEQSNELGGGPPGDRTRDTVIKRRKDNVG